MRQFKNNHTTTPIRIDSEEYYEAMRTKDANKRSMQKQVSYQSKVGRYAIANPDMKAADVVKMVIEVEDICKRNEFNL